MNREVKKLKKLLDDNFGCYTFFKDDHHYELNGKRVGTSVTRLIETYSNPFEEKEIASKYAKKYGLSVKKVLKQWEYKRLFACTKGSTCHEYAQSLWSGEDYEEEWFDCSVEYILALRKIQKQAREFFEDYKDRLIHIKDEQIVGLEEYDIASAIDHLFYDTKTKSLIIVDYKTNSILKGYNDDIEKRKYTKNMLKPLNKLKDDAITHYMLQLSIYKFIIETKLNISVERTQIVYFSENETKYNIIDMPYLKKEVELMLNDHKRKKEEIYE